MTETPFSSTIKFATWLYFGMISLSLLAVIAWEVVS